MSDTGKQSPLGVNVNNALISTEGLQINPKFTSWVGTSHGFTDYAFGRICQETVLRVLTWAIHEGYYGNPDGRMYKQTFDNIINIGNGATRVTITSIVPGQLPGFDRYYFDVTYSQNIVITAGEYIRISGASPDGYNGNWIVSEILGSKKFRIYSTAFYGNAVTPGFFLIDSQVPGLGNAKPGVYTWELLNGPYGTGKFNLGDTQGWGGNTYQDVNPATQWAYIRLLALQAWMEFNYNSTLEQGTIENPRGYRDFLQSFQNAAGFISYSNDAILAIDNSKDFLDGTFSNMNDLITGDITNVTLSLKDWGQDLIRLGKALDLTLIEYFGLPSALLKTLAKYNAITKNLSLAIIAAGIPTNELGNILGNISQPTIEQERKLYASFVLTVGDTLKEILISLNCKTEGLESLADLLDPKKLFPNSYKSLTVPIYRDTNTPPTTTTTTAPTQPTSPTDNTTQTFTYTWIGPTSLSLNKDAYNPAIITAYNDKWIYRRPLNQWNYTPQLVQSGGTITLDGVVYQQYSQAISSAAYQVLIPPAVKKITIQVRRIPGATTPLPEPRFTFKLGPGATNPASAQPSLPNFYGGQSIGVTVSENNEGKVYTLFSNTEVFPTSNDFGYLYCSVNFGNWTFDYGPQLGSNELYIEAEVDPIKYKVWFDNLNWTNIQTTTATYTPAPPTPAPTTPSPEVTSNLTNSKIYYLLYNSDGGVNSQLTSTEVVEKVGIQTLPGNPLISEAPISETITVQAPVKGFGSYLSTIVPPNIAVTAGAFATAVKQIKNIREVPVEKFAQVVTNLETMAVTNQNGTQTTLNTNQGTRNTVPTNLNLRTKVRPLVALGSGPQGSYTVSDFFGCMSGLPYNGSSAKPELGIPESGLEGIYNKLKQLATTKLFNIYHELYLAVTWQRAKMRISQPYWYVISKPYVPPKPGPNEPNPDYDPSENMENPAYNPSLPPGPGNEPTIPNPDYDPQKYLYEPYDSPVRWIDQGEPEEYDWYYRVDAGLAVNGGGYSRGSAPPPTVTLTPNNVGASYGARVDVDDNNIPNSFGRVQVSVNNGGPYKWAHTVQDNWSNTNIYPKTTPPKYPPKDSAWVVANMPEEIISIEAPPIEMLPVTTAGAISNEGVNTPGYTLSYRRLITEGTWWWPQGGSSPGMNQPIQGYIGQANLEIDAINAAQRLDCIKLNNYWNSTGYQLTIEQRARMMGLRPPLSDSRENYLSIWPTTMYTFTDSLPNYGKNTEPHMYSQTIENIANWDTIGGQSMVAMMRQDRNQARLSALGIELDNNIPDKLPYEQQKVLIANGTLPTGGTNPNIPAGAITPPPDTPFTPPTTTPIATPVIIRDRTPITTVQAGTIDINTGEYVIVNPIYDNGGVGIIDNGEGIVPGSFAGSAYTNLIPPNLNSWYSSSTLMPSTYTVNSAIEEVIRCNCDCWNLA